MTAMLRTPLNITEWSCLGRVDLSPSRFVQRCIVVCKGIATGIETYGNRTLPRHYGPDLPRGSLARDNRDFLAGKKIIP